MVKLVIYIQLMIDTSLQNTRLKFETMLCAADSLRNFTGIFRLEI